MKNYCITVLLCCLLAACSNRDNATNSNGAATTHAPAAENNNNFANVQFAADKDLVCHMPLSAGITDTAIINSKIYGFCSPECKNTYVKENRP